MFLENDMLKSGKQDKIYNRDNQVFPQMSDNIYCSSFNDGYRTIQLPTNYIYKILWIFYFEMGEAQIEAGVVWGNQIGAVTNIW